METFQRLSELIIFSLEETITEEQVAELNAYIEVNPEARRFYMDFIDVHANICQTVDLFELICPSSESEGILHEVVKKDLTLFAIRHDLIEADAVREKARSTAEKAFEKFMVERQRNQTDDLEKLRPKTSIPERTFSFLLKIAAILMFALALIYMDFLLKRKRPLPQAVAMLEESIHAKWADMETPFEEGNWLYTGDEPMRLQEGLVKVKFDHGAEVILEAPCEFNFLSADKMKLDLGRLCAKVSQKGHGFTVAAPGCSIIDLGTEFGVIVTNEGLSEAHVLDGQVELWEERPSGRGKTPYRLHKGQMGSFNRQGDVRIESRPAQPTAFVRSLDREAPKTNYVRKPAKTPGLVAHWNFNEGTGVTAADSSGNMLHATLMPDSSGATMPQWIPGPIGFGNALHFSNVNNDPTQPANYAEIPDNDLLDFHADQNQTIAMWIKVDRIDDAGIQIAYSHRVRSRPYVNIGLYQGHLYFQAYKSTGGHTVRPGGGTVLQPDTWYHIAGTWNRATGEYKCYLNGVDDTDPTWSSVDTDQEGEDYSVAGPVQLGKTANSTTDGLEGAVDEIYVFDRALTQEEIHSLISKTEIP